MSKDEHTLEVEWLVSRYLSAAMIAQLATVKNSKPWVCNVYFVIDKKNNLYWLSEPSRRHSQEIEKNKNVAICVAIKTDVPVIGLQAEGKAEQVTDLKTIAFIMVKYIKKYGVGQNLYKRAVEGINKHSVYRMKIEKYSLFDEVNYPKSSPQKLTVKN